MPEPAFRFTDVHVRAMPGFPYAEGFSVEGLGPGVNVIHGPNEIGKSTLGRAMQLLLWADLAAGPGVHLEARVEVGGAPESRSRHLEELEAQDPAGASLPPRPGKGAALRSRYQVALQDLLQREAGEQDGKGEFSQALAREVHGVDLEALRRAVNPAADVLVRGRNAALDAQRSAWAALEEKRRAQSEDRDLEARIEALQASLDRETGLREACARIAALDRALEAAAARIRCEAPLLPFGEAAPRLRTIHPRTAGDLKARRQALAEAGDAARALEARREGRMAERAALALARDPSPGDLARAQKLLDDLLLQGEALAAAGEEARAAGEALRAWAESAPWLGAVGETLPPITDRMLAEAATLAHALEDARAEQAAWTALATDLRRRLPEAPAASRARVLRLLEAWLAADARRQARREALGRDLPLRRITPAIAGASAAALVALSAAAFTLAKGQVAAGGLLALAGLAALGYALQALVRQDPSTFLSLAEEERACLALQADLAGAGVGDLAWEAPAVRLRLEDLLAQEAAWLDRQRLDQLLRTADDAADAARQSRRRLLADQGRAVPGLGEGPALLDVEGYLRLVVEEVRTLQGLRVRQDTARAAAQARQTAWTALEAEVRTFLGGFALPADPEPRAALEAALAPLRRALDLQRERLDLDRDLDAAGAAEVRAGAALAELLADYGAPDAAGLEALVRAWADWRPLQDAFEAADATLLAHLRAGAGLPAEAAPFLDPAEPPADRLAALDARRDALAADLGRLQEELGALEARREELLKAKVALKAYATQAELASAAARHEETLRALEDQRLGLLSRRALALVLDRQARLADTLDRPPVLQRASDHFLAFTGRYELTFTEGRFLAREGATRLELDQLSEGTRVQLLLAVRLAFVEKEETLRLPLFLDEILGNSDDARSGDIVRAVLALAATGRQVFYFTAQMDEVNRWREIAGDQVRVVDLAAVRRKSAAARRPVEVRPRPEVPAPAGRGLEAYARDLGLPGPAVHVDLSRQHPWLVLVPGEEDLLAQWLAIPIDTLGLLRRHARQMEGAPYPRVLATLQVLETAQRLLAANLGRRLAPRELLEAPLGTYRRATKEKFLPALAAAEGDIGRLLAQGVPAGLKQEHLDALGAWAEAEGVWNPHGLTRDEIRVELRGRCQDLLPAGDPAWAAVDRFVDGAAV
ncbi:hypothetical protein [Mesoterricola sediminis]|uniref:Rad50/SbcC-type AAA domain-containing protein n=1 Tax=Mesoterricola sediminis TaxID=2927980 RepID=A0AA48GWJ9_9BACT|nr:hypothetical protein [Mesoterricola sediminis]BDU77594.1 hypothetical protein METESE_25520 [Mesoterricola sediminis]